MRNVTTFLAALALALALPAAASAQCFQTANGFSAELLIDGTNTDGSFTYVWDATFSGQNRWVNSIWFQTSGSPNESVTVLPEYSTWTFSQVASAPGTGAPALLFEYQSGLKLQRDRAFTFAYTTDFQDPVRVTARLSDGSLIDLTFTSSTCGNLPVELTAFEVRADGRAALVSWQTASETNNQGFAVQMSKTGTDAFQELGFVPGAGTTLEAQAYSFRTSALDPGVYTFRLKQVDFDGATTLSAPFEVEIAADEAFFVRPFANPLRGQATLAFAPQRTERVRVAVYNAVGQQVAALFDAVAAEGETVETTLDASALPGGVYLVRFAGETMLRTVRVVVLD